MLYTMSRYKRDVMFGESARTFDEFLEWKKRHTNTFLAGIDVNAQKVARQLQVEIDELENEIEVLKNSDFREKAYLLKNAMQKRKYASIACEALYKFLK